MKLYLFYYLLINNIKLNNIYLKNKNNNKKNIFYLLPILILKKFNIQILISWNFSKIF